ncbi:methyltransferase (plasmid) [Gemmatirosa kalamazoonensis]|uniref:S-adenosyl-L-methionine-dependent methyltransferase n=1 Tax=Gemmatirosa kalamazoonensis TaxID=861299 RepID=W0RSB9_9BACT|nr:class I SAM-dependent methyltransferase [Gemmatirosa kalamazoonensis]AHG93362.1 methyltransferase [Gemmatirosa kalamazoonensis]
MTRHGAGSTDVPRAASSTARGVAVLRAAHLLLDGAPPILNDTVIARLLGDDTESRIRGRADELQAPTVRGLRSHVLLRSRFTEDALEQAVADGVEQYVLLGAGLDTFAYRQPPWASRLAITEVDHPASQTAKRAALARAGIAIPVNLRFADVDFERESLAEGLARCGVDAAKRTFFSWLGVTMYLTREAIHATLRTVRSFASGSEIVLTFAQPNPDATSGADRLAGGAAAVGEPWISYFTPEDVAAMLRSLGFSGARFLSREEAAHRYYAGRADGLSAPRRVSIVSATV